MDADLKIGTSGFSFKDWYGPVYPKGMNSAEVLSFYENELGFDCVEINSTYYSLVSQKSFESMEKKTGKDFEFVVKGFRGITHDPFDPRLKERPNLERVKENIDKFIFSLSPVRDKGKLGAVLLQFPVFFTPSNNNRDFILICKDKFGDIPVVVEFRNSGWAKDETFEFLRKEELAYCAVDEPKLPRLMPFIPEVTSDISYFRLHGRNRNWFGAGTDERYDYLYSEEELGHMLPEIKNMAKKAKKGYIFFNNCHAGQAVKNALTVKSMLTK